MGSGVAAVVGSGNVFTATFKVAVILNTSLVAAAFVEQWAERQGQMWQRL